MTRQDASARTALRSSTWCLNAAVILAVICATYGVSPRQIYRSEAIVGVGDPATPLREALTEAAATAAVSKPVIERAAASLNGTGVVAPAPALVDRLRVGLGLLVPAGRDARLAEIVSAAVTARAGDAPGIVKIAAAAPVASDAAAIATATAQALVAVKETEVADLDRRRAVQARQTLEGAKAGAAEARKKFQSLGGTDIDPAQTLAAVAAQSAAAQARLDVVNAIVASGKPPLSDRHDLPQTVAGLQSAYLDLSQQLAKSRETYGERHTVVISLQEGVKRAAANLTTEWKRLAKLAEAELETARSREAASRKVAGPTDAAKRAAIEAARQEVLAADAVVVRAESAQRTTTSVEGGPFRLIAVAPTPVEAGGLSWLVRLSLALGTGLLAALVLKAIGRGSHGPQVLAVAEPQVDAKQHGEPRDPPRFFEPEERDELVRPASVGRPLLEPTWREPKPPRTPPRKAREPFADLAEALRAVTPIADVPVLLVAANEASVVTSQVALDIAKATADQGDSVLLVEFDGSRRTLGAVVPANADASLVDVFGSLRVALQTGRNLWIAPSLNNGGRIAADLARAGCIPLHGDLAASFDLIVVDGRAASESAEIAEATDVALRVGLRVSPRDDDRFLATLGLSSRDMLGTIVGSRFTPCSVDDQERFERADPPRPQPQARRPDAKVIQLSRRAQPQPPPTAERRRLGAR